MRLNFEDLTKLEVGDTIYETAYGMNIYMTLETKPIINIPEGMDERQVSFDTRSSDGAVISILVTEGLEHYGPSLYSRDTPEHEHRGFIPK